MSSPFDAGTTPPPQDNPQQPPPQQPQPNPGVRRPAPYPPQEIRINCQQQSTGRTLLTGCFGALFNLAGYAMIFILLFGMMFAIGGGSGSGTGIAEHHFSGSERAKNKIAIITISGVIYGGEDTGFIRQIEKATEDKAVKAVVLRIDSPGGTVSGSDYYHHKLLEFKKKRGIPIVVSMGDMATSGGYYLAVTGDEIYAEPSTITGSIGVIMPNYDLSELCEKVGVQSDPITSGPLKEGGSITRKMTVEERAVLESVIDDMFDRFKKIVCDGRPALRDDPELLAEVTTGRIFLAKQALDKKLIDKIGYIDEAIDRAVSLAGLNADKCNVVRYSQPKTMFETMVGVKAADLAGPDTQTTVATSLINDITSPKAYYIYPRALPGTN